MTNGMHSRRNLEDLNAGNNEAGEFRTVAFGTASRSPGWFLVSSAATTGTGAADACLYRSATVVRIALLKWRRTIGP